MTDDIMRDLVAKHDGVITSLVASVEHLVTSQTETNKRLEEISKFLAKQVLLSNRLETMDKELAASFNRVHTRMDEMDTIQKSENGCNSVRLLTKDIETITKDVSRLTTAVENNVTSVASITEVQNKYPSTVAIRWGVGILILYSITFGTYVTQSINGLYRTDERLITLLDRDIKDTAILTAALKTKD